MDLKLLASTDFMELSHTVTNLNSFEVMHILFDVPHHFHLKNIMIGGVVSCLLKIVH